MAAERGEIDALRVHAADDVSQEAALAAFEHAMGQGWVSDGVIAQSDAQAAALKGYNDLPVNNKVTVPESMTKMLDGAVPDPTKAGYSTIDAVKAASEFSTLADRFAREVTGS